MATPRTELDLLLSRIAGSRIGLDVDGLVPHLPLLDEVVATTANGAALLRVRGRYAPPTFPGEALPGCPGEVNLRLDRDTDWTFVSTPADDELREPAGLWMFDGSSGAAVHRGHLISPESGLVVDLMHLAERTPRQPSLAGLLPPETAAGHPGAPDQLGLLDGLLLDGGAALADLPGHPVDERQAGETLARCCEIGLPVGIAVPNHGAVQVHTGAIDHVEVQARILEVVSGAAQFAVSLDDIAATRLVQVHGAHGPTSALLLFDDPGQCAAVLTRFGVSSADRHRAWERIADTCVS